MSGMGFSWVYSRAMQKHCTPSRAMHDAAPFPTGDKPVVIVNETRLGGFSEAHSGNNNSQAMHDTAPFPKGGKPVVIDNASRLWGFLSLQQERLQYRPDLKQKARALRARMTDAEQLLWFHLRRKQMDGVQFFRQRPVGEVILDFYAPSIGLAVEVDGGQHFDADGLARDGRRTTWLTTQGIDVIRFDNLQVLKETSSVLERIHQVINDRKSPSIPL